MGVKTKRVIIVFHQGLQNIATVVDFVVRFEINAFFFLSLSIIKDQFSWFSLKRQTVKNLLSDYFKTTFKKCND